MNVVKLAKNSNCIMYLKSGIEISIPQGYILLSNGNVYIRYNNRGIAKVDEEGIYDKVYGVVDKHLSNKRVKKLIESIDDDRFSLVVTINESFEDSESLSVKARELVNLLRKLNKGKSGNIIDFELNKLNENSHLVYVNLVRNTIDTSLIIIKRGFREVEPKLINLGYNFKYFREFRYTRVGKYIKGVIWYEYK